jgi:putative ABC transport system permease protein
MISIASISHWLVAFGYDLRFGRRTFLRSPLATAVMIASIAIGIGVATAVFTIADVMLMRPLPFPMADRLVVPFQTVRVNARAREDTVAWTFAHYDLLQQAVGGRGLDDVGFAAWSDGIVRLPNDDRPVRVEAITRSLLTTFSIEPQSGGRLFDSSEDGGMTPTTVVMISDRLWHAAFGASAELIGSTIEINASPVRVIGVMPPRFTGFTIGADVWIPIRMMSRIEPASRWTERLALSTGTVIARMSPGTTLATLDKSLVAAMPLINEIATDRFVADKVDRGIGAVTLAEARRHPLVKPILELMAAAVIGLLAIVCANIASVLLARGHARRGEMGVRIALGASRGRVARQVLTECALLAAVALPCGIMLGWYCADALAAFRPALPQNFVLLRGTDLLAGATFEPNLRVLMFGSVVAAIATIVFGIGPAVAASRVDAKKLIATSGDLHATAPVGGRHVLVVSQIAVATILLISAGLTLRSLRALLRVDLGFRPDGVVTLEVASVDTSASARVRRRDLITQLSSMPGVSSVATAGCVPFDLACTFTLGVHALGGIGGDRPIEAELHAVSSEYFRTMGIALGGGREFTPEDSTTGRVAVVLSETAARQLYGNVDPVGKQIAFDQPGARRMDVIGVVRDVRFRSVDASASPAVYTLAGEEVGAPRFKTTLFVRTRMTGPATAAAVGQLIRSNGAPMSMARVRTLSELVRAETSPTRFVAALLLGFAVTALLLASLGVYGVISYTVSHRTKELGLRMVLGANDQGLLIGMLSSGSRLVAAGLGIGVVVALASTRLVASFLFGIETLDATTYVAVIVTVGAIGMAAMFIPARRILRIDPGQTLRV